MCYVPCQWNNTRQTFERPGSHEPTALWMALLIRGCLVLYWKHESSFGPTACCGFTTVLKFFRLTHITFWLINWIKQRQQELLKISVKIKRLSSLAGTGELVSLDSERWTLVLRPASHPRWRKLRSFVDLGLHASFGMFTQRAVRLRNTLRNIELEFFTHTTNTRMTILTTLFKNQLVQ